MTQIRFSSQVVIDANKDFNGKKITNLANGTNAGDATTVSQVTTLISNATSGLASALHVPVADLTALKAVVSTTLTDKELIHVETLGLYRWDAESTDTADDNRIIQPTDVSGAGRWLKMSSSLNDHNALSNLNAGDYKHLTATEKTKFDGIEANADVTDAENVGSSIAGASAKATPVDADSLALIDSENSNVLKRVTLTVLKALFKTYFDTQYFGKTARTYRSSVSGTPNGVLTDFTISTATAIVSGSEEVFLNGLLQNVGAGNDYTISYGTTNTITFNEAPATGDVILVNYNL